MYEQHLTVVIVTTVSTMTRKISTTTTSAAVSIRNMEVHGNTTSRDKHIPTMRCGEYRPLDSTGSWPFVTTQMMAMAMLRIMLAK